MTESDLIQTGIYGLDQIFLGGILKSNLILVEGARPAWARPCWVWSSSTGALPSTTNPASSSSYSVPEEARPGCHGLRLESGRGRAAEEAGNHLHESGGALPGAAFAGHSLLLEVAAEIGGAAHFHRRHFAVTHARDRQRRHRQLGPPPTASCYSSSSKGWTRQNLTAMLSHEVLAHDVGAARHWKWRICGTL